MIARATPFAALLLLAVPAAARPEPGDPPEEAAEAPADTHGGHRPGGGIDLLHGGGPIIPFGAMLVNFAALAIALIVFARRPLGAFLLARHRAIRDGLDEAQSLRTRALDRYEEYGRRLAAFQEEIDRLIGEFRKAGESERARILGEAEEKAARLRREAEFLVSQEVKQVRIDLHREAAEKAVRAAAERLRAAVTPSDQERLADEYLATLSKETRA